MEQNSVGSQERPLLLLSLFSEQFPEWRLSDLARASRLPKASCLRALLVLQKYGLVSRVENSYRLGSRVLYFSSIFKTIYSPRDYAIPTLKEIRKITKMSAQWVVRENLEGIYLEVLQSPTSVRLFIMPGRRAPLYAGASTRLLLSFASSELQEKIFLNRRKKYTPNTPTAAGEIRQAIHLAKKHWLTISLGELEPYSVEIAAPVFDHEGNLVAAISVAGAESQLYDPTAVQQCISALDDGAERISRILGFNESWNSQREEFIKHASLKLSGSISKT